MWYKAVLKEPMLWILFAGYLFTGLGLIAVGASYFHASFFNLGVASSGFCHRSRLSGRLRLLAVAVCRAPSLALADIGRCGGAARRLAVFRAGAGQA